MRHEEKIGSISTSKCTHLAAELRCGIYRKVTERKRALLWRRCIFVYVSWLNSSHGDICNSTYARFSMRRPRESQLILSFFLCLGDCMVLTYFRQLSESKRNGNFACLFYAPEASYLWFAICSLPFHAGNFQEKSQVTNQPLFLSQQKQDITCFLLLPHLCIMHWRLRGWQEWVSVPSSAKIILSRITFACESPLSYCQKIMHWP